MSTLKLNPTHTFYKYDKISFVYDIENDNRKVVANENISKGELLILEHGISDIFEQNTNYEIINRTTLNILYNESFYNELYPRVKKYNLNDNDCEFDTITDIINEKISKNIFKHNITDKKYFKVLFRDITNLNHSIDPNANFHYIEIKIKGIDFPIIIYYIICCKDILKGSEICINYGNKYFNENTDLTIYNDKAQDYFTQNDRKIKKLVFNYLNTTNFRDVIYNHYFYSNGIIFENNVFVTLPTFFKILKGDENVEVSNDEINTWLNLHLTQLSNYIQDYIRSIKIEF